MPRAGLLQQEADPQADRKRKFDDEASAQFTEELVAKYRRRLQRKGLGYGFSMCGGILVHPRWRAPSLACTLVGVHRRWRAPSSDAQSRCLGLCWFSGKLDITNAAR